MIRKSLFVLANSMKRNERCVAGRELVMVNGQTVVSSWVRPVSARGDGELTHAERVIAQTRAEVAVGDILEVGLVRPASDPTQPENWVIFGRGDWMDVRGSHRPPSLDELEEQPTALWLDPATSTDRVRAAWVAENPPPQSLYVIRAERLVVKLGSDPLGKPSYRCRFDYCGLQYYNMGLTDPKARRKLDPQVPRAGDSPVDVPVGTVRVCVSLARPFQGFHYKVVATILEGL
jgi:Dual OB-containing domain